MSNSIRYFAETAKSERDRKALTRMADSADELAREIAAMPEWAKARATDVRVPVSVKVEHDDLEVESWTSKRGNEMHRVHWLDGTSTDFTGDLSKSWIRWDHGGIVLDSDDFGTLRSVYMPAVGQNVSVYVDDSGTEFTSIDMQGYQPQTCEDMAGMTFIPMTDFDFYED